MTQLRSTPRRRSQSRATAAQMPYVRLFPVLVAIVVGAGVAILSEALVLRAVGVGIIGLALLISDVETVKRAFLALLILEIPVQVDTFIGYDPDVAITDAISGHNVSLTTFALIVLYGFWIVELVAGRAYITTRILTLVAPAAVYVGAAMVSIVMASNPSLSMYKLNLIIQAFLILFYVANWIRTRADILFVVTLLLIAMAAQGIVALGIQILGSPVDIGPISTRVVGARIGGTMGHPNALGGLMTLLLPMSVAVLLTPVPRFLKYVSTASLALGLLGLILTQSRGAWIGFGVAMVVFGVMVYRSQLVPRRVLGYVGAASLIPVIAMANVVLPRLGSFDDRAAQARLPLMQLAWNMIRDNPVFGVGLNNYSTVLPQYLTIEYSTAWISTVHNKYLLVWAETGLVGILAFLVFLGSLLFFAFRVWTLKDALLSPIALGLGCGIGGLMFHMLVSLQHARSQVQILWLVAGLLIGVTAVAARLPRAARTAMR